MTKRVRAVAWLLAAALCVPGALRAGEATGASPRTELLASDLLAGKMPAAVRMQAFTKPAGATAPAQVFEGRLKLDAAAFEMLVIKNSPFSLPIDASMKSWPPFDFAFVQDDSVLIPVQRGPVGARHRDWEIVLEPGEAWNEAGDSGYTRASIPFALRERNANCLHNGVLTFLFKANGEISRVAYQISSETCLYFKFDAWGTAAAHYTPHPVEGAAAVKAAYRNEVAARLPVRPLADLAAAHPEMSPAGLGLKRPTDNDLPTLYGVVVDGVNYVAGCDTRAGPYPYCDVLDLPSYSTAKTLFAAVGLMRLEKLWPGARNALIADYVPECATPDWQGVTFENVLDMTSGLYREAGFEADEMSPDGAPFFVVETHDKKIAFSCGHYHRRSPPGTTWVYRTADTYVLATAMQAFARRKLGPQADLYRDVHLAQLWRKLGLSPVLDTTLRTYDTTAQPFGGYGLTYHRDDIARLAGFFSTGRIGAEPMLDEPLLNRALQKDPAHRGKQAGFPHFTYTTGTWARDIAPVLGCSKEVWVPFMSGYGGNSVVMLPNGVVYYYFGDSEMWDWAPAAVEINKLRPLCP